MRFFAIIAAAAAIKLTHKTHHRQEDATKPAKDGEGKADDGSDKPATGGKEGDKYSEEWGMMCSEISEMVDDLLKESAGENDVITKAEAMSTGATEEDWADAVATADGDDDGKLQKSEWGALKKSWMDDAGCSPKPKDGKKGGKGEKGDKKGGKKDGEGKGDKPAKGGDKDGEGSKPAGGEKPEKSDDPTKN